MIEKYQTIPVTKEAVQWNGQNFDEIKESHTKEIAKALPNAKLAIIEGSHFIASENPKVFNRVVEQWLSRVQHER